MATTILKFSAGSFQRGVLQPMLAGNRVSRVLTKPALSSFSSKTTSSPSVDDTASKDDVSPKKKAVPRKEPPKACRSTLVKEVAKVHSMKIDDASKIVENVFDWIVENVNNHGSVSIVGFGTFDKYETKARKGINPNTMAPLDIPSKNRLRFKPSTAFKDAVNSTEPKLDDPVEPKV